MKVVINSSGGGFCLSKEAYEFLGLEWDGFGHSDYADCDEMRTDPKLIECVETLGKRANGNCARLKVVEIPDDVKWYISEHYGSETIEEQHRRWY